MLNQSSNVPAGLHKGLGRLHPVWLTFSNPALEQAYKSSWRNAVKPTSRIWSFFGALFYALMSLSLYRIDAAYLLEAQWFRLYVCAPMLVIEFTLAYLPGGNKRLFDLMYLVASLCCFGNAAISHGAAPDHLKFFFLLELSLIFVFCGSYFRATYLRVTVFVACALALAAPIILYVHFRDEVDAGRLLAEMIIITAMAGTILLTAYHRELLSRRNYREIQSARLRESEAQELADLALADSLARSQFLSNVGSEFQLTLDSVTSVSNGQDSTDEKLNGYMRDVHWSALRLQKTVRQIMDFAVGTKKRHTPEFVAFSLVAEVAAAIERSRYLFDDREPPTVDSSLVGDAMVFADVGDIRDILDELIGNAAKHGTSERPVNCSLVQLSPGIQRLRVVNPGPALSDEQLKDAFAPFVQLDDPLERSSEGLGLGLPLARKLAEINGGRLYLESPASGGTTAMLELPVG